MLRILVPLICAGLVYGQAFDSHSSFDAASVKPSLPPGPNTTMGRHLRGGPGSTDPGTIIFTNIDLFSLVTMAYGINAYQLVGPDWLNTTLFDITAKVPPGTTREQYRLMLQNLLAERFMLAVHRDKKEGQAFDLVVAKSGPKLKESAPGSVAVADDGSLQPAPTAPSPPQGYHGPLAMICPNCSIEQLAARLSGLMGQPVANSTGLHGAYDIRLRYSLAGLEAGEPAAAEIPNTIFDAVQEQLGLKFVPKKASIDLLVIDRIAKAPREN
jgi:uncharacterized protein (TIGR03435 family)